ncbi:MAG: glutaredoxin domain-containing protein [Saezia sp.]
MKNTPLLPFRYILMAAMLSCTLAGAYAQTVYRVTTPDGRVVFTNTPKPNDNATPVPPTGGGTVSAPAKANNAASINANTFPSQLLRAYQTYPVTLYTTDNCPPCSDARNYLKEAGIPFVEYTVTTVHDIEALKKETSVTTATFPIFKIGSKTITNFQKQVLSNYLEAAGYPKTNQLPQSYVNPAPQPLTAPVSVKPAQPTQPANARPTPTPTTPDKPRERF